MYLISEVGIKNAFSFKSTKSILLLDQLTTPLLATGYQR